MIEIMAGIISGIISGTGMGGGTVLILCLSIFLGVNQKIAQATNLLFFIPTSMAAIYVNYKQKIINLKVARKVIITGMLGAIIGAMIAQKIEANQLRKLFGIFLAIIAFHELYILYQEYKTKKLINNNKKEE